jgi:hypothetical protein
VSTPPADDIALLDNPPPTVVEKIEQLLPVVLEWYTRTEQQLLSQGRSLTQAEQQRASELGVADPGKVRVVVLQSFPLPEHEIVRQEAIKHGFGSPDEGGRTHGYLILLKPEQQNNSVVLSHELVHVAQLDRMGREAFLKRYLTELETLGYARSPLELEAYAKQLRID